MRITLLLYSPVVFNDLFANLSSLVYKSELIFFILPPQFEQAEHAFQKVGSAVKNVNALRGEAGHLLTRHSQVSSAQHNRGNYYTIA